MLTIGAMILVLGVLIFVHELGHFIAAKSVGIAVLRFSIGMGPKTPLVHTRGETEYCISWIPFGGYVKMAGLEEEGAAGSLEGQREGPVVAPERTFDAKPLWARVWVISAGVMMNAIFCALAYAWIAAAYGVPRDTTTTVGEVQAASLPMGAAGLAEIRPGERIVRVGGDSVTGWRSVLNALLTSAESPLRIELEGRETPIYVDVPLRDQEARGKVAMALVPWHEPVLGDIAPGYPAAAAGLRSGDMIVRVNGDTVPAWEAFVRRIERSAGTVVEVEVRRGEELLTLQVEPRSVTVTPRGGEPRTVGRIGAAPFQPVVRYGALGSIAQGARGAVAAADLILFTLKGLILGQLSPRDLGGPILIGQLAGEAARIGPEALINLMALLSMNLAILNLLPIPVLDGGHLMFLAIEGVRRRPLSLPQRQRLTQIGFVVLVALMLLAIGNDLVRVFNRLFG
jgi:regulator of sigma E protease